ncbi:MAG: hypothetical protein HY391_05430 [Deltaproteobacteria bacterium]|nr:hypothetical protein [Deltaproteobacteria bacterium]
MSIDKNKSGRFAAALFMASVACFILGLLTTGAVMSSSLKEWLTWSQPVGPLSGKTLVSLIVWLLGWGWLHWQWKNREISLKAIGTLSVILFCLALLLLFPPFFEWFEY